MSGCLAREHDVPSLKVLASQQECLPHRLHNYLILKSLLAPFFLILSSALITQKVLLIDEEVPVDGKEMGNCKRQARHIQIRILSGFFKCSVEPLSNANSLMLYIQPCSVLPSLTAENSTDCSGNS